MRRLLCFVGLLALAHALGGRAMPRARRSRRRARAATCCAACPTGAAGFSIPDAQGVWRGFDVESAARSRPRCSATASRVRFASLSAAQRFTAVQTGRGRPAVAHHDLDLAARRRPRAELHRAVVYYDGQGFLVPALARCGARDRARRRLDLHDLRHERRAEHARLRAQQQLHLPAGDVRANEETRAGLPEPGAATSTAPIISARRDARRLRRTPKITSSCPTSSRRSRWRQRCARATTSGSTSCASRSSR